MSNTLRQRQSRTGRLRPDYSFNGNGSRFFSGRRVPSLCAGVRVESSLHFGSWLVRRHTTGIRQYPIASRAPPSRKDRIFKPDKFSRHGRQSPIERKPTLAWSTGQPRWRSGPFGGGEMGTAPFGGGTATYL